MLGSELKLDMSVRDKTLKKPLEAKYFDCYEPISPEVSHTNYKLDTFKGGFKDFERINIAWMLMCCRLVQNKIDCFQLEDFFECPDTDSEADLVDNQAEFDVEQDAQEEASQDRQEKAGLECNNVLTSSEGKQKEKCPTWSTFNSFLSEKQTAWSVGIAAPLHRRSPKEWPVLFTILKQAQKINCIVVGEEKRTIVTLDGDLYDHAVKLKDYKKIWCIRLGALHITIEALKCLGKFIEGSGLAWEISGVYG